MLVKLKLSLCLLLFGTLLFSQTFPDTLSKQHLLVEGTNIYMVPPDSFSLSPNFKGFQNPDDPTSMIMIMEVPGPFSEVAKGFNAELLEPRGMDLKQKKEVEISGFDGFLLELDQGANGLLFSKHILVYGDESATTLINGVFLKDSLLLGQQVKQSVLSTVINTDLKADPRQALSYTLDESVGQLQFHSVVGNGMLLNRDLKTPTESEDRATLITDKSFAKVDIEDKKTFCISRLKSYPDEFVFLEDKAIEAVTIDGLSGYALYANNIEDETEEMYQVVLFGEDGGYYLFVGSYLKGKTQAQEDINKIIKTFKRK